MLGGTVLLACLFPIQRASSRRSGCAAAGRTCASSTVFAGPPRPLWGSGSLPGL
jgi:hypothetical protein